MPTLPSWQKSTQPTPVLTCVVVSWVGQTPASMYPNLKKHWLICSPESTVNLYERNTVGI